MSDSIQQHLLWKVYEWMLQLNNWGTFDDFTCRDVRRLIESHHPSDDFPASDDGEWNFWYRYAHTNSTNITPNVMVHSCISTIVHRSLRESLN